MKRTKRAASMQAPGVGAAVMIAIVAALVLASEPAWALCPNCLGQTRSLTPTLEVLGGFLLVPFVVFFVAVRAIRRACGSARTVDDRR